MSISHNMLGDAPDQDVRKTSVSMGRSNNEINPAIFGVLADPLTHPGRAIIAVSTASFGLVS